MHNALSRYVHSVVLNDQTRMHPVTSIVIAMQEKKVIQGMKKKVRGVVRKQY